MAQPTLRPRARPGSEYRVRARVHVGEAAGPWSRAVAVSTPAPLWLRTLRLAVPILAWLVWELGMLATAFAVLFTFGLYYDTGAAGPLRAALVVAFAVHGSSVLLPILLAVAGGECALPLPPLAGAGVRPFTELDGRRRRGGAACHGVLWAAHYLGVLATLVLLYLRVRGVLACTWLTVVAPLCAAGTVAPALVLPLLHVGTCKGRRELGTLAALTAPLWGALLLTAAKADDMVVWTGAAAAAPLFAAAALLAGVVACGACAAGCGKNVYARLVKCALPFGLLVGIPAYIVFPVHLAALLDDRPNAPLRNTLAPLLFDIALTFLLCALSACVKKLRPKRIHKVLRKQSKLVEELFYCRKE